MFQKVGAKRFIMLMSLRFYGLGFPEFESFHLKDFSIKAQFSKSAASTIPPCPHDTPDGLQRFYGDAP